MAGIAEPELLRGEVLTPGKSVPVNRISVDGPDTPAAAGPVWAPLCG